MTAQPRPDDLAQLRAELAAQRTLVHAQQARLARLERRRPHRWRRLLPLGLMTFLVALVPLGVLAVNPFNDLTGGVHDPNIDLLYTAGITTGCVPNVAYCPTDLVTREQMASFLARTAGLGGNAPVANAKTAQTATNAAQLGGQPAAFYQPAGQPIANATNALNAGNAATLGGYAPSGLVRVARATSMDSTILLNGAYAPVATLSIAAPAPGFVLLTGTTSPYSNTATDCLIRMRLRHVTAGVTAPVNSFGDVGLNANATRSLTLAQTYVFPVATAGTHAFASDARTESGTDCTTSNSSLTALFVPFGATGGATLADVPAEGSGSQAPLP